jgi:hypothetical protein
MSSIECQKYRIEIVSSSMGFSVSVSPLEYLDKQEFKAWVKLCKRNFMSLASQRPWHFIITFTNYDNALLFAKNLARQLGECVFFDRSKGQLQIVVPKEQKQ